MSDDAIGFRAAPHTGPVVRRFSNPDAVTAESDGHYVSVRKWRDGWGAECHRCRCWLVHTGSFDDCIAATRDHVGEFQL